jgi:hypothetical protein
MSKAFDGLISQFRTAKEEAEKILRANMKTKAADVAEQD